jgi:uncharacterized repeat protein (TIGR01451 family)
MNGSRVALRFLLMVSLLSVFAFPALAQEADLLVTKDGPPEAAAGTDVSYSISVTNIGPDDSLSVTLNDVMPAGMTFVSSTQNNGPAFSCTDPGAGNNGPVNCTIAQLNAGASANFTFVFHIDPSTAPGVTFTNVATVSSQTFDPNDENNSASASTSTPVPPTADLAVSKSGPSSAAAGSDVTYLITIVNSGPGAATSVQLDDTLPGTMTFVSLVQNGGPAFTCNAASPVVCTLASFPAGQVASFTLTGNIPVATPSGTTFENHAIVSSSNDPTEENNQGVAVTTVSSVDLQVTKTGPASVNAGSNITYTIDVVNNGPDTASSVFLNDSVPAGTTFVSFAQNNGPVFNCTMPFAGTTGNINCLAPFLGNGQTAQFSLVVMTTGTTASVSNTATVSTTDSTDSNAGNNSSTFVTAVTPIADMQVVKSGPATVVAGQTISYSITVTNGGPSTAANVVVGDTLPPSTTFASLTQTGFICTTPAPGAPGSISCTMASMASGASSTLTLVLNVLPSASGSISNTATVGTTTQDPSAGNDSSNSTATVTHSADLSIVKSGATTVGAGGTATYTITAANAGPSDASIVTISDTMPAGTTFASLTQNSGPLFVCVTPAPGTTGPISCTIATFVPATPATFTLVLNVAPGTSGTISNVAAISAATSDPAPGNNTSTSVATVAQLADLAVTKTATPTVTSGANITYTIGATNNGPAAATSVVLADTLPAGTTFVSLTQTSGPVFTCTTPAAGANGPINCTLASMAPAATASFDVVVASDQASAGTISNTATISSATSDPTPANNTSTASTTANPGPTDVSIVKTANGTSYPAGAPVTYTIVVTNNGPAVALNTVVTDVLPAGMSASSATSTQGTCTGTTTVTCTIGTMLVGANATITLIANAPNVPGAFSNTATVTTTNTNTNPAGGVSSAGASVSNSVDAPALSPEALAALALLLGAVAFRAMKS